MSKKKSFFVLGSRKKKKKAVTPRSRVRRRRPRARVGQKEQVRARRAEVGAVEGGVGAGARDEDVLAARAPFRFFFEKERKGDEVSFFFFSTKKRKEETEGKKLEKKRKKKSTISPDSDGRRPGNVRGPQGKHRLARAGAARAGAVVAGAPLLEDGREAPA